MKNSKHDDLIVLLRSFGSALVAFSGGVDSTFLLACAKEALGDNVLAITGTSALHPGKEHREAIALAQRLGVHIREIKTTELSIEAFCANPPERCYICKKNLFSQLKRLAEAEGFEHVIEGSNLDDTGDFRPGMAALAELEIDSPLREVGLTKSEIREFSRSMGLPTWNKASFACLASRIPYGDIITPSKLSRIEQAEDAVRELGIVQLRVRDHGTVARIEVGPEELATIASTGGRQRLVAAIKKAGYKYVCLDLEGYRTGAMNETLSPSDRESALAPERAEK